MRDRPDRPLPSGGVSRGAAISPVRAFCGRGHSRLPFPRAAFIGWDLSPASRHLALQHRRQEIGHRRPRVHGNLPRPRMSFWARSPPAFCPIHSLFAWGFGNPDPRAAGLPWRNTFRAFMPCRSPIRSRCSARPSLASTSWASPPWRRTETGNPRIPPLIGALIRGVIFIQAAFCALSGGAAGWIAAGVLLALWPISRLVGSVLLRKLNLWQKTPRRPDCRPGRGLRQRTRAGSQNAPKPSFPP